MSGFLLYDAALAGAFGRVTAYPGGQIADALFVYADGEPDETGMALMDAQFRNRPVVCLTEAWRRCVEHLYPEAKRFQRTLMKPASRFTYPAERALPEGCAAALFDESAFAARPFSHGENYPAYDVFCQTGSGAVVRQEDRIVASASSFLSYAGEVELDVSVEEAYRRRGLAEICVSLMLKDCEKRGIRVHWDAQNDASRRLAEKFGMTAEKTYTVYWF